MMRVCFEGYPKKEKKKNDEGGFFKMYPKGFI